jgi:hypothetical protein
MMILVKLFYFTLSAATGLTPAEGVCSWCSWVWLWGWVWEAGWRLLAALWQAPATFGRCGKRPYMTPIRGKIRSPKAIRISAKKKQAFLK